MTLEQDALAEAWLNYKNSGDPEYRNQLIVHYMSMVRSIAAKMSRTLPTSVERDDLISYGTFGLIEALDNYDPERGVKFATFAYPRIRGSMVDGLRRLDWVPRSVRAKSREIEKATEELHEALGRTPEDAELAQYLGLSISELHEQSAIASIVAFDDHGSSDWDDHLSASDITFDASSNPEDLFATTEITTLVATAVASMPERSKTILVLYYLHHMTLAEIGEILGVTESRVCQLQSKVLQSLRDALGQGALVAA